MLKLQCLASRRLSALMLAAAVTQVAAAPDEAAYGAALAYPPGDRSNWFRQDHLVGAFTAMEQLFPVHKVTAGPQPRSLPGRTTPPDWNFVQSYLDRHPVTGLLVMKDGQVAVERYQYGRRAVDRFTSFSMAKTVVSMAVGIALAEGRIASIDEPVDQLEPALAGTAWKGVALRQVLNMASGVRFDETYDKPDNDIARLSRAWARQEGSLLAGLQRLTEREAAPGARFHYVSAETQVLAQVLIRATGRPLADYVSEKIWAPMGAEADATWVLDAAGVEAGYCCLSARLRDWARLGQLLLDGGQRDGKQIIPRAWIEAATTVRPQDGHLQPRRATPYFGYGYQTWIFPEALGFALLGVRGQAIFVHPQLRLVMVQTAVWPTSSNLALSRERDQFWRELIRAAPGLMVFPLLQRE
jgi:CubicO group peptidase (beta-lactamase class C family)